MYMRTFNTTGGDLTFQRKYSYFDYQRLLFFCKTMTINKHIISMTCVSILFFGCNKDDYEGPLINELYGDFMINDSFRIINDNPDFSIDEKVKFYCNFNKTINGKSLL